MRFDQGRIDADDDQIFDVAVRGASRRYRSVTAGDQRPHVSADLVAVGGDLSQCVCVDVGAGAPRGRGRCDGAEDSFLVSEDLDIGDGGAAAGDRYCEVSEDSAAVVDRIVAGQCTGKGVRQADFVGEYAGHDASGVGHDVVSADFDVEAVGPLDILHVRGAPVSADFDVVANTIIAGRVHLSLFRH